MKVFRISTHHLRLLDGEFASAISKALADIARSQNEPEIRTERLRPDPSQPSTWMLVVTGDGIERRFSAKDSMIATAFAVSIYASDFADDLRADLKSGSNGGVPSPDYNFSWSPRSSGGVS